MPCMKKHYHFKMLYPQTPLFGPKMGQNIRFLEGKSTETPLKHRKLGINRIIMIFVIYWYNLHVVPTFPDNSIAPNPPFWAQNGSEYPFSGHKLSKTPLKHGKLGITRVVIIVVIYQYTLHEAKAIFHYSIAPNPLFLGRKWVKMSVFRGKVNRNTTKA